jgi:hypothetical protein
VTVPFWRTCSKEHVPGEPQQSGAYHPSPSRNTRRNQKENASMNTITPETLEALMTGKKECEIKALELGAAQAAKLID